MLPDSEQLVITPRLLDQIAKIEEFKGRWREITWLSHEVLARLRRTATIESVGSSTRIEGSKLSDREVESLLESLKRESFASRDEEEVAGYAEAMNMVFDSADILTPNENHVLQMHSVLLRFSSKDQRHRGAYKTLPNHVTAFDADGKQLGIVFETTSPFDTPQEMEALTSWLLRRESQHDLHPLLVIGCFIVVFLKIHPFQDGNGRLSRILTTLLLLRAGYGYVPFLSLESIVEQNKEAYYRALRATQMTLSDPKPQWTPWLEFFLMTLWKQTVALETKVDALGQALQQLSAHERELLDLVEKLDNLSVAQAVAATGAKRETVRKRLANLVNKGFLILDGRGRGASYRKR